MSTIQDIVHLLQQPTPHEHVKFLPKGMKSKDGERWFAMAIPYVDIAFVRQRLDDACGPFGWKSEVDEATGLAFCGISIRNPGTGEWVSQWDTGQDDPWHENGGRVEGEKFSMGARGIFSISFKRAAYQWGVGRDVLAMRVFRCECDTYEIGGKTHFKGWIQNPLVKQVEEYRQRQALPPATEGNITDLPKKEGSPTQVTRFENDDAERLHGQCLSAAAHTCGMTREQYQPIFDIYENDGGCRVETYADLFNKLQDYRRAKMEIIKGKNEMLGDGDRPYNIESDLHAEVSRVVNLA